MLIFRFSLNRVLHLTLTYVQIKYKVNYLNDIRAKRFFVMRVYFRNMFTNGWEIAIISADYCDKCDEDIVIWNEFRSCRDICYIAANIRTSRMCLSIVRISLNRRYACTTRSI